MKLWVYMFSEEQKKILTWKNEENVIYRIAQYFYIDFRLRSVA